MPENTKIASMKKHDAYCTIKEIIDTTLAALGLIILLPLFLVIIIAIKLEDGIKAPVFFSQLRVGLNKKQFKLYKFRSMRMDTPHDTPTHLLKDPNRYITKIGRILRKTSLDELPQLFNILVGDMSMIGPRPALWNQYDLIAARDEYHANDVKPGLTGWAQIHGRDELDLEEKVQLDGYYVENFGFALDCKCFFKTFLAVLKSDGVVEGGTGALHINKKNKIMMITNHSYMLWQFRHELMEGLLAAHELVVVTPFVGHEADFEALGIQLINIDIERRGQNPLKDFKLMKKYRKIIKNEAPNFVVTYSIKPNIYAGIACKKLKVPYFANVQGLGTAFQEKKLARLVTIMYRIAFSGVTKVFFENESNAARFRELGIVDVGRQVVLKGAGVNLDRFALSEYPNNECVHFLYLGRIMREKGIDELFASARRLFAEGKHFVLDLVGFFEEEYEAAIKSMENEGIAVFHGFQQNPIPFYQAADCVVLPSYHEGMSNVLLEAAAIGRPLITSDIPGCREAVNDRESGFLVKAKDENSLHDAMDAFLELDNKKRMRMGIAGRRKIEMEFDRAAVVAATIAELEL